MGNQEQVGGGRAGMRILWTQQAGQGLSQWEVKSGQVSGARLWAPGPCSRGHPCGLQKACSVQVLFAPCRDY